MGSFEFSCAVNRLDIVNLFSFFEELQNVFIGGFLREEGLKSAVIDFPPAADRERFERSSRVLRTVERREAPCGADGNMSLNVPIRFAVNGFSDKGYFFPSDKRELVFNKSDLFLRDIRDFNFFNSENLFFSGIGKQRTLESEGLIRQGWNESLAGKGGERAADGLFRSEKGLLQGYEGEPCAVGAGVPKGGDAFFTWREGVFSLGSEGGFSLGRKGVFSLGSEEIFLSGRKVFFEGMTQRLAAVRLFLGENRFFEKSGEEGSFASTLLDRLEEWESLSRAAGIPYRLTQKEDGLSEGFALTRRKEGIFEKSLFLCCGEPEETYHISPRDLRNLIGAETRGHSDRSAKTEIRVDMSGMKNTICRETSIESIVADLTSAVSEAVTAAAEGVHIL